MSDIAQAASTPSDAEASNVSDNDSSQGAGTVSQTDSGLRTSDRASDTDSFSMTKGDTDSQRTESDREQEGGPLRVTRKYLLELFKKDWRQYYRTFELNEKLYLHYKGFEKIENMHLFPELKCLYFEGNGITEMTGLETNTQMMSLMLQENLIRKMEGLHAMVNLHSLNLAENNIFKIEGLENCHKLTSVYLKKNKLGCKKVGESEGDNTPCISAIQGLLECPSIESIDIQSNWLSDPEIISEVFQKMPNLKVLYLQNNKVVKNIKNYRKNVISDLPKLCYLDDRPVFEDDRRNAEAFTRGGLEEERKERDKIKQEKHEKHEKYHRDFKEMMRKAKMERMADIKKQKEITREEKEEINDIVETFGTGEEQVDKENAQPEPRVVEITEEEDCPPELEQVDIDAEREKAVKKKEWQARIEKQQAERENSPKQEEPQSEEEEDEEPVELEQVVIEEKKEQELTKFKQEITPTDQVTDFDELD